MSRFHHQIHFVIHLRCGSYEHGPYALPCEQQNVAAALAWSDLRAAVVVSSISSCAAAFETSIEHSELHSTLGAAEAGPRCQHLRTHWLCMFMHVHTRKR